VNIAVPAFDHAPGQLAPSFDRGRRSLKLTHLEELEAESIHIIREAIAESERPVLLYSIGKDSSVLLHLAAKAFFPGKLPFPVLHINTTWKFLDMIAFRDRRARELGLNLIVHVNQDGPARGIGPSSDLHTDVMKTQALRQALDQHGFDAALGGARRDEEISRAKERVFSFRNAQHRWDPKRQRAEPWRLYNGRKRKGESIRVFPLSNWTELDVWLYIHQERIPVVPHNRLEFRPTQQGPSLYLHALSRALPSLLKRNCKCPAW
jgi:sulfate adenylyltransferase subunit 2